MPSKAEKKFLKKKARERKNHEEVLKRREKLRADAKAERLVVQRLERADKLRKEVRELAQWSDEAFLKLKEKTMSQLEKNAKILKALEEEYEAERAKRADLNKELEDQGLLTLEDKMKHLHDMLVEDQKSQGVPTDFQAESETADVSVTKASAE